MAKIGTAHIEVKPVLDEAALDALCATIERRIREAVTRGSRSPYTPAYPYTPPTWYPNPMRPTVISTTNPSTTGHLMNDGPETGE